VTRAGAAGGRLRCVRRDLHQGWTVRATAGPVPAELVGAVVPAAVPGCVHTDLLAAGLVPDPYLDENEALLAWVGEVDWRYETTLRWDAQDAPEAYDVVELVAEGLDTVAAVELDGTVLARTRNMHRTHRVDVTGVLTPGEHALAVTFAAPVPAARRMSEELGPRPCAYEQPFNAIRKMACSYGWDWGPALTTSGIWRPLRLHAWRTARLGAVRPLVDVRPSSGRADGAGSTGVLHVHVDVVRAPGAGGPLTVAAEVAGRHAEVVLAAGETVTTVELEVDDVALWWPVGHGDQPLYPVAVTLAAGDEALDAWSGQVGFRTVALDTTPDDAGTPFRLVVNGEPVFARGLNWIPDDCFPTRVTAADVAARLGDAVDVGANLVRVWGGGLYESEDFYDACDRLGLMVWQDFLFACAAYAEEEPLRSEVEAEAREAVTRLAPHPSLVLWNGNNENIWGHEDWGWVEQLDGASWGWGYYTDLLPRVVAELDGTRPYCPGSPYAMDPDRHPNDPAHGPSHLWDVWNAVDHAHYRDSVPRFVAEFGWQAPPTWATLTRAVHDDPLAPDSPGMVAHQKAVGGEDKLSRGLAPHLPEPETFDDWHWSMTLNQARAVTVGVEHLRSWTPVCSGAVWWQLNDCWPVTSWAVVDGDGRRKPAWYALRRAFADRLLTVQPRADGLAVVLVNDHPAAWDGSVRVRRLGLDGTVLAQDALPFAVGARDAVTLPLDAALAVPVDAADEVLLAEVDGRRGWWWFAEDRDSRLRAPGLDAEVRAVPGGHDVVVHARTLLKDLAVLADRAAPDAEVDELLVSLLPGETTTFRVTTAALDGEALLSPLVLRSANQLVSPPERS